MKKDKKIHVLFVHGGMTFQNTKDYLQYLQAKKVSTEKRVRWSDEYLEKSLGKGFEVVHPRMPLQDNAKYRDWKIMFENHLPLLNSNFILIGSSLGGVFLAKYLSENKLKRKALSVYLVCPPYDNSLPGEDLVGGFALRGGDFSLLERNAKNVYLMFSENDDVVPVAHAAKYRARLKRSEIFVYDDKNGHFNVEKFPEIVRMIKADVRNR